MPRTLYRPATTDEPFLRQLQDKAGHNADPYIKLLLDAGLSYNGAAEVILKVASWLNSREKGN